MQITHQEARHLIQYRADQPLDTSKKESLNAHLRRCEACAEYANEVWETEATLRETLRKHWDVKLVPLDIRDIQVKSSPSTKSPEFLATRSALVGMAVLVCFFVFWQFTSTNTGFQNSVGIGVPAVPTPSLPLTSTQNNFENCQMLRYEVRQNDTVESLARQFLVSEESIKDLNNLQADVPMLPNVLLIPACELTPTGTTYPPTAITNTPSLELITYTPG
jgi:hypothetical protein